MKARLFVFGWPSHVGGADTKLNHLLPLLREMGHEVMCIANAPSCFEQSEWTDRLTSLGITWGLKESIPEDVQGEIALSLCNPYFHNQGFCEFAKKERGLKVIWSSEMMWHHDNELNNVKAGYVDKVLYVSDIQKSRLEPGYEANAPGMPWSITGNFVDPDEFPFHVRKANPFSMGRLSRASPEKYPEDFPVFYDEIASGCEGPVEYHVMGWNEELDKKYSWFKYKGHNRFWYLYSENQIPTNEFFKKIHLHAYPLGHNFVESWGRSTVEGMLTGAIPISFSGHHITTLVENGVSGHIVDDVYDWRKLIEMYYRDPTRRILDSQATAAHARDVHCNRDVHKQIWEQALTI